jgi:hypothetical protein
LSFIGGSAEGAILIDDVSVVPEPTVAAIFGVGALVLGVRRNRRAGGGLSVR